MSAGWRAGVCACVWVGETALESKERNKEREKENMKEKERMTSITAQRSPEQELKFVHGILLNWSQLSRDRNNQLDLFRCHLKKGLLVVV